MIEYHFYNSSGSNMTGAPHPRVLRVGVLVWNAKGTEAVLRARSSSFSDVQLLPADVVVRGHASKKHVCQENVGGWTQIFSWSTPAPPLPFPFLVEYCHTVVY